VAAVLARGGEQLDPDQLEARFDRALRTHTPEGIVLEPLYTAEDAPRPGTEGLPGAPPFTRGAQAARAGGGWDVRQRVVVGPGGVSDLDRAVEELERGATSVLLDLREAPAIDTALLNAALRGVDLSAAPLALEAGTRWQEAWGALRGLWAERGVRAPAPGGCLGADPIGEHAAAGGAGAPLEGEFDALARAIAAAEGTAPGMRLITVDASRYHSAGGSRTDEIAAALATALQYLRTLEEGGVGPAAAAGALEFRVAADAGQFMTIAALRALRRTWARVGEVLDLAPELRAARIHAVASDAMLTRYDPHVNLLRGTIAAFAAGVGGADAVTVAPFDALSGPPGALGRRMARNTQRLLIDEAGVGRVVDPAGGSHYVERLTDQLARAAWEEFQGIEARGGMLEALRAGAVQEKLVACWQERLDAIAHRRTLITGVSAFPDINEPVPAGALRPEPAAPVRGGTLFPPLVPRRYAEPFERRRARADRHEAATGERPAVFLATLGTPAEHTARAGFAKNLFESAGIRSIPSGDVGPGDDVRTPLVASGARLACICSSHERYAAQASEVATQLAVAGAHVYLAGRPGDDADALRAAGVHEFIHDGIDALDVLTRALDAAGVER
jgi:methylmalonyl-CoA mutase